MVITLIDIVFFALLATQLVIAFVAAVNMRNLEGKYAHPLGSKITMVEVLQKYSRIFTAINIKVDARISHPSLAEEDTLLVNRRVVYSTGLYANFFTIFQILLIQPSYRLLAKIHRIQIWIYLVEILMFALGIYLWDPLVAIAIALGVLLLISSFVYQSYLGDILNETLDLAVDLLDLDELERARTVTLISEMQSQAFVYAYQPLVWLVRFVLPYDLFNRSAP